MLILLSPAVLAAENDLSVAWIARTPRIDYVWNSSRPTVEGWPAEGDTVTWVANVRWLGTSPLKNVGYRWLIDGRVAGAGTLDFAPESLAQAQLPWTWTFARHRIVFEVDPLNLVTETEERNNRLLVYSNALGVGIWVERTFWEHIRPIVKNANIGATTFDDWMQRQIRRFNEMAASAIYPDTPDGVLDRWRIDEIHLVEDGALPLVPPYSEARDWGAGPGAGGIYPNVLDHSVDMQWGFPAKEAAYWDSSDNWTMTNGNSIDHELGHARTMIDVYASNITTDGDVVPLNPSPPAQSGTTIYSTPLHGLMHYGWGRIDPYSAAAMNRMTGSRAVAGNYNEPWNIGWFLNDLPAHNRVRFLRSDGTAIANRRVRIYQSTGEKIDTAKMHAYAMIFRKTPDIELTTDGDGAIVLDRKLFGNGPLVDAVDQKNGVDIVEIADGNTTRWAYLDSLLFNMAYWRGETDQAEFQIVADAPLCLDSVGTPSKPEPEAAVTTPDVTFQFNVQAGHTYDLFYTVEGGTPQSVRTTRGSVTLTLPQGRIVWWFVDLNPVGNCLPKHSTTYGFDHLAGSPPTRHRAANH